jgi:magnesium-transporting ATPase (P-type)
MATSNKQRLHVKGASEIVLKRCDTYLDGEGNRVEMTSADMDYFNETIDNMADKGNAIGIWYFFRLTSYSSAYSCIGLS